MEHEDFAAKLAAVDARAKSNTHRLDELEADSTVLHKLATAMEQRHQTDAVEEIKEDVTALGVKVDTIEKKPAKRWEGIVEKALWAVCAAVIAFLLGRVGL